MEFKFQNFEISFQKFENFGGNICNLCAICSLSGCKRGGGKDKEVKGFSPSVGKERLGRDEGKFVREGS